MEMKCSGNGIAENGEAIAGKLLDCKKQLWMMLLSLGSLVSIFFVGSIFMQQLAEQTIILCLSIFLAITLAHAVALYCIIRRELALVRASKQYMLGDSVMELFESIEKVIVKEKEYYHTFFDTSMISKEGGMCILEAKCIRLEDKMKR